MSYILDALRRADAQRRQGQAPALQQIAAGPAPSPGRGTAARLRGATRALAAAALLAGAGLALGWWWGRRTGEAPAPPIPPSSPISSPIASVASVASIAPTASTASPAASAPAVQPQVHADTPGRAATKARAPASRRARHEGKAASSAAAASTTAATAVAQAASAPGSAVSEDRPLAAAALPEPLRSRVARLGFGGAVQSQDRSQSFVLMDGQLVREGQTLAPGIVLERIDARSLRLRVDGRAVELAL